MMFWDSNKIRGKKTIILWILFEFFLLGSLLNLFGQNMADLKDLNKEDAEQKAEDEEEEEWAEDQEEEEYDLEREDEEENENEESCAMPHLQDGNGEKLGQPNKPVCEKGGTKDREMKEVEKEPLSNAIDKCETLPWYHFEDSQLPDHMVSPEKADLELQQPALEKEHEEEEPALKDESVQQPPQALEKDESAVAVGGRYVQLVSDEEGDEVKAAFQDNVLGDIKKGYQCWDISRQGQSCCCVL